jgi:hypothetical protein
VIWFNEACHFIVVILKLKYIVSDDELVETIQIVNGNGGLLKLFNFPRSLSLVPR